MRSIARLLIAAFLIAAGSSWIGTVHAQPAPIESYVLDNGLTVVIAPDSKVPKVAVTLKYKVGVANEPAGRSGFAHLFEHLMFAGTPAYPDIDTILSAEGLSYNATTSEDETTYFAAGMAAALPVILSVYADQAANIGAAVTEEDLATQRAVVRNERRQNVLDSPGASAITALQTGMFPAGHPYHRALIGSIADLEAATLEDVRAFFNAYYVPANAVLAIVGDVEVEAVRGLVADTFGRIPRIPVQSDQTAAALAEAIAGFDSLIASPVTEAELKRSLMSYLSAQAGLTETAGGFFSALVGWERDGIALDEFVGFLARLTALELEDVRLAATLLAGLDRAVIAIAGDPDIVLPQLAAEGFTDIETVDLSLPAAPPGE